MSLSDHIALGEILTSGQLAQRLAATGLTADAARQAISRSNDPAVWVLPLRLPRRARLFARRESGKKDATTVAGGTSTAEDVAYAYLRRRGRRVGRTQAMRHRRKGNGV